MGAEKSFFIGKVKFPLIAEILKSAIGCAFPLLQLKIAGGLKVYAVGFGPTNHVRNCD